jgi:AraC-like DNA-binding protein
MEVIFIIGTAMAFFFGFLLLQKSNKGVSDIILAIWMFVIGLHLFSAYGATQDFYFRWPILIMICSPFPLLHGPFLLIYIMSLIREERKIRRLDYLHFIPYFLGTVLFIPFLKMSSSEIEAYLDALENGVIQPWYFMVLGISLQLSGIIYAVVAYFLLKRHKKRIENRFSFEENVSLKWLRYNIIAIGLIYLIVIFSLILEIQFGIIPSMAREYMIYTAVTIFVIFFGYYGIRQESIFVDSERFSDPSSQDTAASSERYSRSGLKENQKVDYYQQLLAFMDDEKPYLESKLTLQQLASMLDLSPNHLSQVINEKANQNFYQFINSYRIKAFKEKIQDSSNQHLTLLSIALDCGFNSKSSFNNTFKKITGMTPSQYQRSLSEA